MTEGTGLNNIGLLLRTCGKFAYAESRMFAVDDGSGVDLKCIMPDGVPLNQRWNHVSVTGISVCETVDSELLRLFLVRTQHYIRSY